MSSHRYWRVYVTASNDATYTSLGCMWAWWDMDGASIDQTSLSYTSSGDEGAYPCTNLKSNRTTYHQFLGSLPHYVSVDFGTAVEIGTLSLMADDSLEERMAKDFKVQYSDDNSNWYDYGSASWADETSWAIWEQRHFTVDAGATSPGDVTDYKGWGIEYIESHYSTYHQIGCEWEWRDGESILNDSETDIYTENDQYSVANLNDGNVSTFHQYSGSRLPRISGCVFASVQTPDTLMIKAHASYYGRMPKTFKVLRSPEGVWWFETGAEYEDESSWSAGEEREYSTSTPDTLSKATDPDPSDDETGVAIDKTFSWTGNGSPDSYDVYFGESSPPDSIGNQAGATYDPGTLDNDKEYFWRIDSVKSGEDTITGDEWSFSTLAEGGEETVQQPMIFIVT